MPKTTCQGSALFRKVQGMAWMASDLGGFVTTGDCLTTCTVDVFDMDGDSLTYAWALTQAPAGSAAAISATNRSRSFSNSETIRTTPQDSSQSV